MIGLFFMMLIAVAGLLGLVAGLRYLGVGPGRDDVMPAGPAREDMHRLQEALSALDARLDRLEDQQRFLERLLEARPAPAALPPAPDARDDADPAVDSVLFDVERGDR